MPSTCWICALLARIDLTRDSCENISNVLCDDPAGKMQRTGFSKCYWVEKLIWREQHVLYFTADFTFTF